MEKILYYALHFAYERQLFTRGCNSSVATGKMLVFWVGDCSCRVYSRALPSEISAIWKKNAAENLRCRVKWGAEKIKDKCYFFFSIKYSKTSLTTTLYSLLLSQLPFIIISPFKHPGFCGNSSPGFFSCPDCSKIAANRATSQSVPISSNIFWRNPFLGPPFLKKGSLKLKKGAI